MNVTTCWVAGTTCGCQLYQLSGQREIWQLSPPCRNSLRWVYPQLASVGATPLLEQQCSRCTIEMVCIPRRVAKHHNFPQEILIKHQYNQNPGLCGYPGTTGTLECQSCCIPVRDNFKTSHLSLVKKEIAKVILCGHCIS